MIVGATTDLLNFEVGAMSAVGGIMPRAVPDPEGFPVAAQVRAAIRPDDVHVPPTRLLCLENTHQRSGGRPIPLGELAEFREIADAAGIPIHVDGARIFNAAVAQRIDVREIARFADSVTFCLSKGLSCPIGSIVVGDSAFIARARWVRKMLGGGMRQAGWIAAAGIVGLRDNVARLVDDHRMAQRLARHLSSVPGLRVVPETVPTNIVLLDVADLGCPAGTFAAMLGQQGVRAFTVGPSTIRFVTSRMVSPADIDQAAEICAQIAQDARVLLRPGVDSSPHLAYGGTG